jgi:hypothetical protein
MSIATGYEEVDWIQVPQNSIQLWDFVYTVVNRHV